MTRLCSGCSRSQSPVRARARGRGLRRLLLRPAAGRPDRRAHRVQGDANSVTMVVQIAYAGDGRRTSPGCCRSATVPDVESLAVFPQRALTALDANTGPQFQLPTSARFAAGSLARRRRPPAADAAGGSAVSRCTTAPRSARTRWRRSSPRTRWRCTTGCATTSSTSTTPMLPYIRGVHGRGHEVPRAQAAAGQRDQRHPAVPLRASRAPRRRSRCA